MVLIKVMKNLFDELKCYCLILNGISKSQQVLNSKSD